MPNPLNKIISGFKPGARRAFALLRREVVGIAQDYWKDGHWEPAHNKGKPERVHPRVRVEPDSKKSPFAAPTSKENLWHALPGEISEKMWGDGFVTPCDEYIGDLLMRPLGITKDMNLLDLSAGLGGRLRKAVDDFGAYITGLEPDPEIAARGMALSVSLGKGKHAAINAYDPMNLKSTRLYDCVIARETIFRVEDKQKFVSSITALCKPKAQVSFTDYVVDPENAKNPAVLAWYTFEKGASPVGLVEMAEIWAKAGISIRVHDDQSEKYKQEVKKGLIRFTRFMASGAKPDAETKKAIQKRITTWAHRMAAMEQGMKFYRFYGLR